MVNVLRICNCFLLLNFYQSLLYIILYMVIKKDVQFYLIFNVFIHSIQT